MPEDTKIIAVVGPCAAGKSTLIPNLVNRGYQARHIAQEHSFVPDMWRQLCHPHILIYLDVSAAVARQRKPQNYSPADFEEQARRLHHAFEHADLYLNTDPLTVPQVAGAVIRYLENYRSHGTQ